MTITAPAASSDRTARRLSKVPEITAWFWVIKILCTTVGEALADYINVDLGFGLGGTALIFTVVLAVVLGTQFATKRYRPVVYWLVVVVVSVAGTLYTDLLTDKLGVPLTVSSVVFTALLALVFGVWYARERTLSIHSIVTVPREAFYWVAVLVTFALGTATGDYTLELTSLTPGNSVLIPIVLSLIVVVGWRLGANAVLAFWLVYILTRPMGANLGDFLGREKIYGGLGVGLLATTLIFLASIAATVTYLTVSKVDVATADGGRFSSAPTRERNVGRERMVLAGWVVSAIGTVAVLGAISSSRTTTAITAADLAGFRTVTQDTLGFVKAGQNDRAVNRIKDLETGWDAAATTLQGKDMARWTELDGKIDTALKSVRASPAVAAKETIALQALDASLSGSTSVSAVPVPASEAASPATAATSGSAQDAPPAGAFTAADVAPFRTVTQDTLALVKTGKQSMAVTRIKDLETGWDDGMATLQAKNPTQWTQIDGKIDTVLKSIRATAPDAATEEAALNALLGVLPA